jgi:hypothetical protein
VFYVALGFEPPSVDGFDAFFFEGRHRNQSLPLAAAWAGVMADQCSGLILEPDGPGSQEPALTLRLELELLASHVAPDEDAKGCHQGEDDGHGQGIDLIQGDTPLWVKEREYPV